MLFLKRFLYSRTDATHSVRRYNQHCIFLFRLEYKWFLYFWTEWYQALGSRRAQLAGNLSIICTQFFNLNINGQVLILLIADRSYQYTLSGKISNILVYNGPTDIFCTEWYHVLGSRCLVAVKFRYEALSSSPWRWMSRPNTFRYDKAKITSMTITITITVTITIIIVTVPKNPKRR